MSVLSVILVLLALIIAWQDFSTRLIDIWLVVAFAATNIWLYLWSNEVQQLILNFLFAVSYLLFAYTILHLYFLARSGRIQKIIDAKVGWGDVLVVLSLGGCLKPNIFLTFLTFTLIATIIVVLATRRHKRPIPLAGFLTLSYCLLLLGERIF